MEQWSGEVRLGEGNLRADVSDEDVSTVGGTWREPWPWRIARSWSFEFQRYKSLAGLGRVRELYGIRKLAPVVWLYSKYCWRLDIYIYISGVVCCVDRTLESDPWQMCPESWASRTLWPLKNFRRTYYWMETSEKVTRVENFFASRGQLSSFFESFFLFSLSFLFFFFGFFFVTFRGTTLASRSFFLFSVQLMGRGHVVVTVISR